MTNNITSTPTNTTFVDGQSGVEVIPQRDILLVWNQDEQAIDFNIINGDFEYTSGIESQIVLQMFTDSRLSSLEETDKLKQGGWSANPQFRSTADYYGSRFRKTVKTLIPNLGTREEKVERNLQFGLKSGIRGFKSAKIDFNYPQRRVVEVVIYISTGIKEVFKKTFLVSNEDAKL